MLLRCCCWGSCLPLIFASMRLSHKNMGIECPLSVLKARHLLQWPIGFVSGYPPGNGAWLLAITDQQNFYGTKLSRYGSSGAALATSRIILIAGYLLGYSSWLLLWNMFDLESDHSGDCMMRTVCSLVVGCMLGYSSWLVVWNPLFGHPMVCLVVST